MTDNLDQDQKRGDHLVVILSLIVIALFQILVPLMFTDYGYSYHNTLFDIGNVVLFLIWIYSAVKCWTMTFETYNGWIAYGPGLVAAAMFIWFMSWGAVHGSNVANGFTK